jgi:NAD(P)-dependent dehydrogenase (short-subunit alcohol dehydrogenase family)
MGSFDGKVVVVTGGALGIGRACAVEFAREGAQVTIADVNEPAGRAAIEAIEGVGGQGHLVVGDVARASECQRVVHETVDRFGGLDVLFNNVGIQPQESYQNVEGTSEEMWDRIIDVNLKSFFLMSKYALPEIRRRGGGAIINTASVQGLQSQREVPAYAASKGGILSLTRQMALDYAAEGIRVLAVCPGSIDTDMARAAAAREPDGLEAALARFGRTHPIGRIGTGQDIANVVLFLASDKASFMTGEYVCVDGGYMALGAWAGGAAASH